MKTLTRNWRDHWRTGTHKHTETVSRFFDRHGYLSQSEESKCLWTHDKDGVTREFTKGATRGLREGWMEGNYLRLMPGLSLEDSFYLLDSVLALTQIADIVWLQLTYLSQVSYWLTAIEWMAYSVSRGNAGSRSSFGADQSARAWVGSIFNLKLNIIRWRIAQDCEGIFKYHMSETDPYAVDSVPCR